MQLMPISSLGKVATRVVASYMVELFESQKNVLNKTDQSNQYSGVALTECDNWQHKMNVIAHFHGPFTDWS